MDITYTTNLEMFPKIFTNLKKRLEVGDVISIVKKDPSGYCFEVPFSIKKVEGDKLFLFPIQPIPCYVLE